MTFKFSFFYFPFNTHNYYLSTDFFREKIWIEYWASNCSRNTLLPHMNIMQYAASYGQILQVNMGIDAEQVRNFFQNKLVHQLFFSPKKGRWRGGADLPMIDSKEKMYSIKKVKM